MEAAKNATMMQGINSVATILLVIINQSITLNSHEDDDEFELVGRPSIDRAEQRTASLQSSVTRSRRVHIRDVD